MAKYCTTCGRQALAGERFCPNDGTNLETGMAATRPAKQVSVAREDVDDDTPSIENINPANIKVSVEIPKSNAVTVADVIGTAPNGVDLPRRGGLAPLPQNPEEARETFQRASLDACRKRASLDVTEGAD